MEEFANFDFNIWRKRYMQWISHLKSRILDVFRSIDRDQDGRISQREFIDYVLASSKSQMMHIGFDISVELVNYPCPMVQFLTNTYI